MDNYIEQVVTRKNVGAAKAYFFFGVLCIIAGVFAIVGVNGSLGLTLIIVGAVLIYFAKQEQSSEYEYLFVNGDVDISVIKNKSSRKDIYSVSSADVLRILPYTSSKAQNEFEVNADLSIKKFVSGFADKEDDWYVLFTTGKSGTVAVILELNDKTLEHINTFYKNKME